MTDEKEKLQDEAVEAAAAEAKEDDRQGLRAIVWIPATALILFGIALLFTHPAIVS